MTKTVEELECELARAKGESTAQIVIQRHRNDSDTATRVHEIRCSDVITLRDFIRNHTMRTVECCTALATVLYELAFSHNRRGGDFVARVVVPGVEETYQIAWSVPHEGSRGSYGRGGLWVDGDRT